MTGDLFDLPPNYGTDPHKLARTESPMTSKDAADSIDTTRLEKMVHKTIAIAGSNGVIADDVLNHHPGFSYSSITARFSALERKGLITCGPDKRRGKSGRGQRVMRSIVEPGE